MKTIIAGGRDLADHVHLTSAMQECPWTPTEIVSGGARGIDALGEEWAENNAVPVRRFPANWKSHGRAAGPIRNREMAVYAEALVAVWDGSSRGTRNMIEEAKKRGLKVHVHMVDPSEK